MSYKLRRISIDFVRQLGVERGVGTDPIVIGQQVKAASIATTSR
jgi:hypothetical protein